MQRSSFVRRSKSEDLPAIALGDSDNNHSDDSEDDKMFSKSSCHTLLDPEQRVKSQVAPHVSSESSSNRSPGSGSSGDGAKLPSRQASDEITSPDYDFSMSSRRLSEASVDFDVSEEYTAAIKLETIEEEAEEDIETEEKAEKETSTVCNFCGKNYSSHRRLRHHIRQYHDENVVQCGHCFKQFKSKKSLSDHMKTHKPMVECNGCNKLMKEKSIRRHKLQCLNVPQFEERKHQDHLCHFCDLRFINRKKLRAHMKTHVKYDCQDCDKSFRKQSTLGLHRVKMHTTVSASNSCGWMMSVTDTDQEPEVIPMDKYHYCDHDHCHYKTKRRVDLKRHLAVHRNTRSRVVKEKKCQICGHQFKTPYNLKRHQLLNQCKKNLSNQVTLEDNLKMLNCNQTLKQVQLNNRLVRKAVGKKKVQSNIDKLLRKAKEAERKHWVAVRVKLWEKDANGKLVLVETVASVVRNATNFMLRGVKGRDYVDPRFCIVSDGGQGKYVIGSTLTDKADPNDGNDVNYKSTGSMRNLLLLQADVKHECYENMVILHKLLKLETFPYPLTYSGDLKLLTAQLGLSGTSGYHSCPFCTGYRKGKTGKKGEKKRWVVGKHQRTFGRLLEKHRQFIDPKGGNGDIKNNARKYENVIHMPIRLSLGNDNRPLIYEIAPGPLHCMLLGR